MPIEDIHFHVRTKLRTDYDDADDNSIPLVPSLLYCGIWACTPQSTQSSVMPHTFPKGNGGLAEMQGIFVPTFEADNLVLWPPLIDCWIAY